MPLEWWETSEIKLVRRLKIWLLMSWKHTSNSNWRIASPSWLDKSSGFRFQYLRILIGKLIVYIYSRETNWLRLFKIKDAEIPGLRHRTIKTRVYRTRQIPRCQPPVYQPSRMPVWPGTSVRGDIIFLLHSSWSMAVTCAPASMIKSI